MTNTYPNKNGWNEWANYVLKALEELKTTSVLMDDKIDSNKETYIEVINKLELSITKQMATNHSEIAVLKKEVYLRAIAFSAAISIITGVIFTLIKTIGG